MEYRSYLIRLWREGVNRPWRISLQDTASGERKGFASLDEAVNFLTHQLEPGEPASPRPEPPDAAG